MNDRRQTAEATRRARDIPREAWPLHPNWPDQVLLVRSHDNFRLVSERVCADARRAGSLHGAARLFRRWMAAMGNHEAYEEGKLYPYLTHRWGAPMDALEAGHHALHAQRAEVFEAFAGALASGEEDVGARARVRAAVDRFDEILREHLALEEDTVVPLLLELSPKEFADYTLFSIERLLRDGGAMGRD